ncbi:MAG: AraC family ligand binding domain-containing protein [Muribaculum sp.]|nr:AraC family ligand binding domain-containing protein [Muribaculum sp.]
MKRLTEESIVPYSALEEELYSFFYIDSKDLDLQTEMHRHDFWELYYVVKGTGKRISGDTIIPFRSGEAGLIPPGMPHY